MNEQIDLFSYSMPRFKIDKPIRLIELFAGIGSQAKALENLGVPFEHWFVSKIDKNYYRYKLNFCPECGRPLNRKKK